MGKRNINKLYQSKKVHHLLSNNRNYLTPFLWGDIVIFLSVHLLFKIFLLSLFRKPLSLRKNNYYKKDAFYKYLL